MKNPLHKLSLILVLLSSPLLAVAHQHGDAVVPAAEKAVAMDLGSAGPTESSGVAEVRVLATMPLEGEFPGMEGCVMRVREITLLPGGQVAVHQHHSRPGAAYVLEGILVEHRNDAEDPVTRQPGDVAMEKSGIIHWWENKGTEPAKVVVVDIHKQDS